MLDDPKNLYTAQNVLPLINSSKASDNVKAILNAVSAKLTTDDLVQLNEKVQLEKQDAGHGGQGLAVQRRPRLSELDRRAVAWPPDRPSTGCGTSWSRSAVRRQSGGYRRFAWTGDRSPAAGVVRRRRRSSAGWT